MLDNLVSMIASALNLTEKEVIARREELLAEQAVSPSCSISSPDRRTFASGRHTAGGLLICVIDPRPH